MGANYTPISVSNWLLRRPSVPFLGQQFKTPVGDLLLVVKFSQRDQFVQF